MLNLAYQERRAILFLLALALTGAGVKFFLKTHKSVICLASFNEKLGKIDLNRADKPALMSVAGIGEKLASRILDYRKEHNGFSEAAELKNINGITAKRYEKLKDLFYLK